MESFCPHSTVYVRLFLCVSRDTTRELIMYQVMDRIPNDIARSVLERCRNAFIEAERAIPGVSSAFVLEIVENVEQVDSEAEPEEQGQGQGHAHGM